MAVGTSSGGLSDINLEPAAFSSGRERRMSLADRIEREATRFK